MGYHINTTSVFFADVTIEYSRGLPQVTVPLPSRKERCRFTLRPISNTVGDFLDMLRTEDKGIDRAVVNTTDGTRIASSTTIETLLEDDFRLIINDTTYYVNTPKRERLSQEDLQRYDFTIFLLVYSVGRYGAIYVGLFLIFR